MYGLSLGPGVIDGTLEKQVITFEPMELGVGTGKVALAPQIDLRGTSPILRHEQGRVIENIQLSKQLCHSWLKYVAPLLADAAEANGTFSADLELARVPLLAPSASSVRGQLVINEGRVGPGTLSRQFLSLADQIKSIARGGRGSRIFDPDRHLMVLPRQRVAFELKNGAVYHRNLIMRIGDVDVTTQGTVLP